MVSYDFGLTEQQMSRAKKLRDESIVIDMLFQGPIGTYALPEEMEKELMALARQKHPEDPQDTTIEHFLDHIDYVVHLVGPDHVGFGTDWPMPQTKWMALAFKKYQAPKIGFQPGDGPSTEYVHGIRDYRDFSNVIAGLVSRGYSDSDITKIVGGNWMRVFREVCG